MPITRADIEKMNPANRREVLRQMDVQNPPTPSPIGGQMRPAKKNKYNAKRVRIGDIDYDSTKEGNYAAQLDLRQQAGEVLRFHRQPIFDLPGGVVYRADFQVFWADGRCEYIDVKGGNATKTPLYRVKKKQAEALYRVKIEER